MDRIVLIKRYGGIRHPVYVKPKNKKDYYSGEGYLEDVQKLKTQSRPNSKQTIELMVCVRFPHKGSIWFKPYRVKKGK